jgi:hypothetical protein
VALRAELRHFLVSGSSEGVIKVWEVPEPEENQLQPITIKQPKAEVNVDARITSVASAIVFDEIVEETQQYVTSHPAHQRTCPDSMCADAKPIALSTQKPGGHRREEEEEEGQEGQADDPRRGGGRGTRRGQQEAKARSQPGSGKEEQAGQQPR